jgi:predicted branched-subunit amino acid permease
MSVHLEPDSTSGVAPPRRRASFLAGARAMVPLALAVTPIGLTTGIAFAQLPVDPVAAWSSSWLLYGASSQLVAVTTFVTDATGIAAIVASLVVNARLALYGAALAPRWREQRAGWRVLASYLIIEPQFIHAQERDGRPGTPAERAWHYLGGGALLWVYWQVVTAVGIAAPALVPHADALWAAPLLCFVAILAPGVRTRSAKLAAATAGGVGLVATALPWGAGILIALTAGMLVGGRRRTEVTS